MQEVRTLNDQNNPARAEHDEEVERLTCELAEANEEIKKLRTAAILQEAFTSELISKYEKMETEYNCALIAAQIAQQKRVGVAKIA